MQPAMGCAAAPAILSRTAVLAARIAGCTRIAGPPAPTISLCSAHGLYEPGDAVFSAHQPVAVHPAFGEQREQVWVALFGLQEHDADVLLGAIA